MWDRPTYNRGVFDFCWCVKSETRFDGVKNSTYRIFNYSLSLFLSLFFCGIPSLRFTTIQYYPLRICKINEKDKRFER